MWRWVRRLALALVLWRLLGPEPRPEFRTQQEHPLRLPGRSVFVGDRELFVREAGPENAPVLVLVHGWAADSILNWYKLIPLLAESYRVVAIDQRNSGKSDYPRERYEIADVADEIAGAISAIGLGKVSVVGYSMGGMIAQELAHRHPHLVDKLILGGTAATVTPSKARRISFWITLALGRLWDRISRAEFSFVRQRYLHGVGAVKRRHGRWMWDLYMGRDVNLYYEGGYAVARFDSRPWLRQLKAETLVMIPTADQLVYPSFQYDLASRIPNVQLIEMVGARHEAVLTHPEEFAQAIQDFLAERPLDAVIDARPKR